MECKIDLQEIEILQLIGNGSFGKVSKARFNSELVAVKQLHRQLYSEQAKQAFRKEARLMKDLGHPRVLVYRGYFEDGMDIGIVMEFMENGSLLDCIQRKLQFPKDIILSVAFDVCSGMNYLHLMNILHRDLKSANVFLDRYNRAKVGDFGLSVIKNESVSKVASQGAGTMAYLGPECFGKNAVFATSSDVFAYGMVLWEMICWDIAYRDVDPYNVSVFVRDGERLEIPLENFCIGGLVNDCWKQNRHERPTFTDILLFLEPLLPSLSNSKLDPVIEPVVNQDLVNIQQTGINNTLNSVVNHQPLCVHPVVANSIVNPIVPNNSVHPVVPNSSPVLVDYPPQMPMAPVQNLQSAAVPVQNVVPDAEKQEQQLPIIPQIMPSSPFNAQSFIGESGGYSRMSSPPIQNQSPISGTITQNLNVNNDFTPQTPIMLEESPQSQAQLPAQNGNPISINNWLSTAEPAYQFPLQQPIVYQQQPIYSNRKHINRQ